MYVARLFLVSILGVGVRRKRGTDGRHGTTTWRRVAEGSVEKLGPSFSTAITIPGNRSVGAGGPTYSAKKAIFALPRIISLVPPLILRHPICHLPLEYLPTQLAPTFPFFPSTTYRLSRRTLSPTHHSQTPQTRYYFTHIPRHRRDINKNNP
ncbi:hypothetical protein LZ31DRAFT_603978 [Colletotrichum somersetense]|nr:hypothetical protein LZ31DRAFT_603978 [Colletotrichum somersetense]